MDQLRADQLIMATREMYDRIAPDFSRKRTNITPDVHELKAYAAPGSIIADIGCGSGRLSELFPKDEYEYAGADFSQSFLRITAGLYPDRCFLLMKDLAIPLQSNSVDVTYSLAMLHHIPSHAYRITIMQDIYRILKPGGTLVCTVWRQPIPPHTDPSLDPGDMFIDYTLSESGESHPRYIHAFSEDELRDLALEAGFRSPTISLQQRGKKVIHENILLTAKRPGTAS